MEHRHSPVFDAFDFDPGSDRAPLKSFLFYPNVSFVARNLLKGRSGEFTTPGGAVVKADDLSKFISMVQKSVLGTEVGTQIEVLADGDVRLALRMTREFLESGYTDPAKAIQIAASGGDYVLPKHEALRSIILGNRPVYSEQYSVIGNPFDARALPYRCSVVKTLYPQRFGENERRRKIQELGRPSHPGRVQQGGFF